MHSELVTGTYAKTVWIPQPGHTDMHMVVYVRPSGSFLWLGYWHLYEMTCAAGTWRLEGRQVMLSGVGRVSEDFQPWKGGLRPFQRTLDVDSIAQTPTLQAQTDLPEWSLLSWPGPYAYVGTSLVIDPDSGGPPSTIAEVDHWIARIVT